jgi:hypothetical protein
MDFSETAMSIATLRALNITHVLNVANASTNYYSRVAEFKRSFEYLGVNAQDTKQYNIRVHFDECVEWMHAALERDAGE